MAIQRQMESLNQNSAFQIDMDWAEFEIWA